MRFQLGELFCGPGGLALGAVTADIGDPEWKIVHQWANDRDEDTCRTYRRNICPDRPESVICADVRSLDLGSLGPIDAFAFGFPCNDFKGGMDLYTRMESRYCVCTVLCGSWARMSAV